jgi:taurine dioxygenase
MLETRKIAGALGAEIHGVDLTRPLSCDQAAFLRAALLEHLVIFFRRQPLSPAQFMHFAEAMGRPVEYPLLKGLAEFPKIIQVLKLEHERNNFGGIWHSDTAYLEQPPMGSMLLAQEVPPAGGDTLFANQYLAYEALSPGMQRMLSALIAVNSSSKADATKTREDRMRSDKRDDAQPEYVAEHPVVRTHPETGRKALYVNVAHTTRFKDMSELESRPLLNYLFEHQTRPEFTCRFRWEIDSIALWDNRCTQHNPINDYHGYRRVMLRITLAGDRPR